MSVDAYERLGDSAVFVERDTGLLRVSGPDRVSWLQGMVTNDVARLGPGEGCHAAFLSPQGKVVSLMSVLAAEDALWLEVEGRNAARTATELDKLLIMEDASVTDCSSRIRTFTVIGAQARSLVTALGFDMEALDREYGHTRLGDCRCVRASLGYDLIADLSGRDGLTERLIGAGAVRGDLSIWDVVRIEAGVPSYGVDVDETTTFPELGEKGIDYDKGCYIGQEVVAKIKYIGRVNRRFTGLRLEGTLVPKPGAVVRVQGRDAGHVTSATWSPGVGGVIALSFLRTGAAGPGVEVVVTAPEGDQRGVTVALPFVAHGF